MQTKKGRWLVVSDGSAPPNANAARVERRDMGRGGGGGT